MLNLLVALLPVALFPLTMVSANPYPDSHLVPNDDLLRRHVQLQASQLLSSRRLRNEGLGVLRIRVDWDAATEKYTVANLVREDSGTRALYARAATPDPLGSFKGTLRDAVTGAPLSYDSIGTGQEFRRLTRAISFRFPLVNRKVRFEMQAENPVTGVLEKVVDVELAPSQARRAAAQPAPIVRQLRQALKEPKLVVNIYADGYTSENEELFFKDATHAVQALVDNQFPMVDHFDVRAVFSPSQLELGAPRDLGLPIAERDSALGLYYPYWENFGRWYNVVYPTREEKFRAAVGRIPYDYALALVNSGEYWGIGNYKELCAIPSRGNHFEYLLTHEFGHFFGLNEEYEGGGATELGFAPGIEEPWSQNITFLRDRSPAALKWKAFALESTPLPTPNSLWDSATPLYGAYAGGYGDSEPRRQSHKPGKSCVMERAPDFCPICRAALEANITRDLGIH